VNNTIHNNRVALNLEQHPVVTDPQAIFRCPVRELFHIASQLVCHGFDFVENTAHLLLWQGLEIFADARFESEAILQGASSNQPTNSSPTSRELLTATDAFALREISLGGAATVFNFGFSMKAQKIAETEERMK